MIDDTCKIDKILPLIFRLDKDTLYDVKIEKHRKKRSNNANSYLWELCTQIGNKMNLSKNEVYLQMLKDYGQSMLIPVKKGLKPEGYTKYYEFECSSQLNGKEADWYKCYKGSSKYDTKEMSILIEGVKQEARQLGIKTLEDYEIEKLIEEWEK